jgi:hypothetical protein
MPRESFQSFWATGTGWGTFSLRRKKDSTQFVFNVLKGTLACRSIEIAAAGSSASVERGEKAVANQVSAKEGRVMITLTESQHLVATDQIRITVKG